MHRTPNDAALHDGDGDGDGDAMPNSVGSIHTVPSDSTRRYGREPIASPAAMSRLAKPPAPYGPFLTTTDGTVRPLVAHQASQDGDVVAMLPCARKMSIIATIRDGGYTSDIAVLSRLQRM